VPVPGATVIICATRLAAVILVPSFKLRLLPQVRKKTLGMASLLLRVDC